MREIISCRMSDRVLLCIGRLSNKLLSKKKLLAGGRGDGDDQKIKLDHKKQRVNTKGYDHKFITG